MTGTHWLLTRRDMHRLARGIELLLMILVAAMLLGGLAVYVVSGSLMEQAVIRSWTPCGSASRTCC